MIPYYEYDFVQFRKFKGHFLQIFDLESRQLVDTAHCLPWVFP